MQLRGSGNFFNCFALCIDSFLYPVRKHASSAVWRFTPLQVCVSLQHLQNGLWPLILLQTPFFFIGLIRSAGGTGKKAKLSFKKVKKREEAKSSAKHEQSIIIYSLSCPFQRAQTKKFLKNRFLAKAKQQFNVTTGCQAPKRAKNNNSNIWYVTNEVWSYWRPASYWRNTVIFALKAWILSENNHLTHIVFLTQTCHKASENVLDGLLVKCFCIWPF